MDAPRTRPQQRSMLNLGMLIALNRSNEFKTHVRAAITNGLGKQDILEVILHATIYCGAAGGIRSHAPREGGLQGARHLKSRDRDAPFARDINTAGRESR